MAATLQELKAQSPAYQGMSDEEFADKLYAAKYADKISRDEFDVRVGVGGKKPAIGGGFMPAGFQRFTDRMMDPFGVRDELMGATSFARKMISGGTADEASQAYAEARDRDRAEQRVAHEDYGITPDLIGGIGAAGLVKGVSRAGIPLATRIYNSMKTGAAFGGASGFGHSEGDIGERAIGAGEGAALGAAVGPVVSEVVAPAIGTVASGLARGARSAGAKVQDTFGDLIPTMRRSADARFARALQRQGMSVDEAAAEYEARVAAGKFGQTQTDVPVTAADLGPATQRQGRAIATIPGRGSTMSEEVFGERQQGQFGRMNEYLRRALQVGKGDFTKTLDKLSGEMKTAAEPAYRKFYDLKDARGRPVRYDIGTVLRKSEIADANLAPSLARTMQTARAQFMSQNVARDMGRDMNNEVLLGRDAVMGRSPTYKLTGRRFDSGKQALDDMIEQAKGRGQANQVRLLTQLKNDLVSVVDRESMRPAMRTQTTNAFNSAGKSVKSSFEVPVIDPKTGRQINESLYGKARDAYGHPAQLRDALTAGRSFMKGNSEMTAAAYKALSTAEKKLFRLGVAREARKALGGKALGQDMVNYFRKPNTMETLSEVMSPAKFKQFMALAEGERGMAQSSNIIRGGSPTANKLADVEDLNAFMTMGRVLKDKGLAGAAFDAVGTLIQRTLQMREVDAHRLATLMFETDVAKNRAAFARLQLVYGPKVVAKGIEIAGRAAKALMAAGTLEAGRRGAQTTREDRRLQPLS